MENKKNDNKKQILIVEDEATSQGILKEILTEKGYKCILASDGEEGLAKAKAKKPNLILLDIILPKIDGFGVLEQIKKDDSIKDIPVILLTNLSHPQDVQKAVDLGATTYLVKSEYQLEDIVKKIALAVR